MFVVGHSIISVFAGGVAYGVTGNLSLALVTGLSSILVDCDHIIDYLRETGGRFNLRDFCWMSEHAGFRQVTLLLHSYELVGVLVILGILLNNSAWLLAMAFGLLVHLLTDQVSNPVFWNSYFILHRLRTQFRLEAFLIPDCEIMRYRQQMISSPSPHKTGEGVLVSTGPERESASASEFAPARIVTPRPQY